MDITTENVNDVLKVSFSGRLVASCSEEFKKTMYVEIDNHKKVLLDLSAMEHIDSSGIGVLVHVLQKLGESGGVLKLAGLQPKPKIVFDITKVYRIFDIYDSVESALEAFAQA